MQVPSTYLTFAVALTAAIAGGLLSPAYLVHGRAALWCNLVGCKSAKVKGRCHKDFELVRQVFDDNMRRRGETSGAVAVFYRGELVTDIWGGEWSQFKQKNLRSFGGAGLLVAAKLIEDGHLDPTMPVSSVWPGYRKWGGPSDITVSEILALRFNATYGEQQAGNRRRSEAAEGSPEGASGSSASPSKYLHITPIRVAQPQAPAADAEEEEEEEEDEDDERSGDGSDAPPVSYEQLYAYFPYVRDVVITEMVPKVDPLGRDLPTYFREVLGAKIGLAPEEFSLEWGGAPGGGEIDSVFVDQLALGLRALGNATDAWCGPLPTRRLWTDLIFAEPKPGFREYLAYGDTFFGRRVPVARATAQGLAKMYSYTASGDEQTKSDIGAVSGRSLFATRVATSCVAQKNLSSTTPAGLDDLGRVVATSACGFVLSTEQEALFTLKETETHGRRWMHFAWSNLGGSYAVASVGHGISVVYLTAREGPYDQDPRVSGVIQAVNEVVYWKEMEEFKQSLKDKGLVGPRGMEDIGSEAQQPETLEGLQA